MFTFLTFAEHGKNWQFGFQIPATPVMEGIQNFHHDLFFFLVIILGFVSTLLYRCFYYFTNDTNKQAIIVNHAAVLEIIWTLIPAIVLVGIAIPSFSLMYSIDEIFDVVLSVKIVGHQWYWSYEYLHPNFLLRDLLITDTHLQKNEGKGSENYTKTFPELDVTKKTYSYDSYMLTDDAIRFKHQRLLRVDNQLHLPVQANVRLLITSADVLHSWAVPALGIKLDACPGRLNQTSTYIERTGTFYGQCSEICGVNHGFMPIQVVASDPLLQGAENYIWDTDVADFYLYLFQYFHHKLVD